MHSLLGIATTATVLAASSSVSAPRYGHYGGRDGGGSCAVVQEVQVDAAMDDRELADELRVLGTAGIHSVPMEVAGVASALGPEAQGVAVESTRPLVTSEDCKKRYSAHLHLSCNLIHNEVVQQIVRSEKRYLRCV